MVVLAGVREGVGVEGGEQVSSLEEGCGWLAGPQHKVSAKLMVQITACLTSHR